MDKLCIYCQEPYFGKGFAHHRCYQKYYHKNRRDKIIAHYGNKCKECHRENFLVLSYSDLSKSELTGSALYTYILNNDYPDGFEVLCSVCLGDKRKQYNKPKKLETIRRRRDKYRANRAAKRDLEDIEQAYS